MTMRAASPLALLIIALPWSASCASSSVPDNGPFAVQPLTFREVKDDLLTHVPSLSHFDQAGPIPYRVLVNRALRVGDETIVADLALPKNPSKAPLVIMSHGNHSRKEAHRYHIERLASFGMFALAVQVPNHKRWIHNGRVLGRLVKRLQREPRLIHRDLDRSRIILAGHSFGGSAITIAAGGGARVAGLILLDPAVVANDVKAYMQRVKVPAMLLGADLQRFRSRQRSAFFKLLGGEIGEVSVRDATHDDAQSPSMFSMAALGVDPYTSDDKRAIFEAAITASAFSIGATGGLDYAWRLVEREIRSGDALQHAKRRDAPTRRVQSQSRAPRSEAGLR